MKGKIIIWILAFMVLINIANANINNPMEYLTFNTGNFSGDNITNLGWLGGRWEETETNHLGTRSGMINYSNYWDGSDDTESKHKITLNASGFTWCMWINHTDSATGYFIAGQSRAGGNASRHYFIANHHNNGWSMGNGNGYRRDTRKLLDGNPHFICGRYKQQYGNWTDVKLYVNGTHNPATKTNILDFTTPNPSGDYMYLGVDSGNSGYYEGQLDEVLIYNYSLSDQEVFNLYGNLSAGISALDIGAPPPAGTPIQNINISDTVLPANNTYFATTSVSFNTTVNSTDQFTCKLYLNGALNTSDHHGSGNNKAINYNITLVEGNYNYSFTCNQTTLENDNTTNRTIIIDLTKPTAVNNVQGEFITNEFTYSINITELNILSATLTDSCGFSHTQGTTTSITNSTNIKTCGLGSQQTNLTLIDLAGNTKSYVWNWTARARLNITGWDLLNQATIKGFSVNVNGTFNATTTNTFYHLDNLISGNIYNISFINASYETQHATITVNQSYLTYNFTIYTTNSFNISIYNEITEALITGKNISIDFISDTYNYSYSNNTGKFYIDLLAPMTYTIRYNVSSGYGGRYRYYYFTLTNNTHNVLDLYAIPNAYADNVTITTYDQIDLTLLGEAVVYVQRRMKDNTYKTVAMYKSGITGVSYYELQKSYEYYKLLVDYPFTTRRLQTSPLVIEEDNLNLYVLTTEEVASKFFKAESITYTLGYVESSDSFTATWTDSEAVATRFCLYIKKYGYYGNEIVNSSCSTSSSGSISLTGLTLNNTIYYALFTATIEGEETVVASAWKEKLDDQLNAGAFGIFMTILLVIVMSFISALHILALPIGTSALIFAKLLGILSIGWGSILIIFGTSLIIAIIIEMKR